MVRKIACLLVAIFILSAIFPFKELQAAKPYYAGKVINIIVGYPPGGGYDRISRVLAKHLPRYIPGNPTILVQNMPGAASMIAANYLYSIAKPDGLTFGIFNRGLPFAQLLKAQGVKFDLRKYSWVGSAAVETTVIALRTDLPFKTVDEILKTKEPIVIAGGGPGDSNAQLVLLLKDFLKVNMKVINYNASSEQMLAVERKEADGIPMSINSLQPWLDRNLLRCWIRGRYSTPEIEKLPSDEDLTTDKVGKTLMAIRSTVDGIGRPYVAPPGTPPHIINILRDALSQVLKDPELRKDAKKIQMTVQFVPPQECLKLVNYILNQPDDIVNTVSKYIKF